MQILRPPYSSVKVLQNLLFPFFSFFTRHLYLTRCLSSLFIHLYSHILLGLTNILWKLMFNYCYFFLQLPTFLKLGGGEEEEGESWGTFFPKHPNRLFLTLMMLGGGQVKKSALHWWAVYKNEILPLFL